MAGVAAPGRIRALRVRAGRLGWVRVGVCGFLVIAAVSLLRFPPGQFAFYPRCPVYVFLGLRCPGCGGTRAVAALLRGEWREAVRWNPLVALLAPAGLGVAVWDMVGRLRGRSAEWLPRVPDAVWVAVLAGVMLFGVLRNVA